MYASPTTKSACNLRWNEEYTNNFVNRLQTDVHLLYNVVQEDISVDRMVDQFTTFITDMANIYFKKATV